MWRIMNVIFVILKETRLGLQCQTPLRSYPLSLIPYPLSLIPCSLSPSTVPFTKFRWGLLSFLWLWLLWLSPAKVKSTPNPRPKTGVWQKFVYFSLMECYMFISIQDFQDEFRNWRRTWCWCYSEWLRGPSHLLIWMTPVSPAGTPF